jgi:hypothetical protein
MSTLGKTAIAGLLVSIAIALTVPVPTASAVSGAVTSAENVCDYAPWWPGCW